VFSHGENPTEFFCIVCLGLVIAVLGVDVELCLPALGAIWNYKKVEDKRNGSAKKVLIMRKS
jgi:hypothetical protein